MSMTTNMMEKNRASFMRIYEQAFNEGRLEAIDECVAENVDDHTHPMAEGDLRANVLTCVVMLRDAMPDIYIEVAEMVAEDNRVVARLAMTGTHTGTPLFGIPAENRLVRVQAFHLIEFDDSARAIRDAGAFPV